MNLRLRHLLTSAALSLSATLAAQAPSPPAPTSATKEPAPPAAAVAAMRATSGMHLLDGQLVGVSDACKILFEPGHVTFTPALPPAPRNMPVQFTVESFGRGATRTAVSAAVLQHEQRTARYVRPEFVETWQMLAEGAELSFRFDALPPGDGDLAVRLHIQTELEVQPLGADAVALQLPGVGGMYVKGVTGIDADGHRFAGSLHYDAGALELRLPAAEVERAALPLVLDPIVGSPFLVSNITYSDNDADVAYDATHDVFLVVFQRYYSSSDLDVHGQFVNPDGTLRGGRLLIENAGGFQDHGRVANVNGANAFLVAYAWHSGASDNIVGRAVRAADGAIGAATTLADTANALGEPDVGGEATTAANNAVLVWSDLIAHSLHARLVTVVANAAPTLPTLQPYFGSLLLYPATSVYPPRSPAISKSGGTTGNFAIAWTQDFYPFNAGIRVAIVTRTLAVLEGGQYVFGADDQSRPEVDGDGRNWVVAFESRPNPTTLAADIRGCSMTLDQTRPLGLQGLLGANVSLQSTTDDERLPNVCWTGEAALVTWHRVYSGLDTDVHGRLVDLFLCSDCGSGVYLFNNDLDREAEIRAASQRSGGGTGSRSLVAWTFFDITSPPAGNVSHIQASLFDADDGRVTELGGGCGGGGRVSSSCLRVGNGNFHLQLREATPTAATLLLLSSAPLYRGCGACTLIADPWNGFGFVAPATSNAGEALFAIPIPANSALSGYGFYAQWAVTGGSCILGVDLSNAIRAIIE